MNKHNATSAIEDFERDPQSFFGGWVGGGVKIFERDVYLMITYLPICMLVLEKEDKKVIIGRSTR